METMTMRLQNIILLSAFLTPLLFSSAANAQEGTNLTILKEWNKEDNLNGGFEALRRDWLAKVREIRQNNDDTEQQNKEMIKPSKIKAKDIAIASNQEHFDRISKP